MKNRDWWWLVALLVISFSTHIWGVDRGGLAVLKDWQAADAKQAKTQACVYVWQAAIDAAQCNSVREQARWEREDLERENRVMTFALQKLFQDVNFKPSLVIQWKRPRLQPMTGILLFNADAMPDGRFTDKNGYVLPYHSKRGERAVFLGECSNGATVFCLEGIFAGRVMTFKPWQRFDRQGVLVYHF